MSKIDQAAFDAAVVYNTQQLVAGKLTAMTFAWQAHHGLRR